MASVLTLATVVVSCRGKLDKADEINLGETPLQTLENMFAVQTRNGNVRMRMEAGVMQNFDNDTATWELFPKGVSVYGYNEEGLLETVLVANQGRHTVRKSDKDELWAAFGNVVIHNVINLQTMETDTVYWDQKTEEIYTDCYVKLYSPDGFMQGYGMRSDDHARNAILHNPFNSDAVISRDTTKVVVDSVNFIGPFRKGIM